MAANYRKFDYQDLPEGHIRLLHLPRAGGPLTYELYQVHLASAPSYIALSYSWKIDNLDDEREGTEDVASETPRDHKVLVNNAVVWVTKNLAMALPHLVDRYQCQYIWIDGICHDQDNELECRTQVGRMGEIYKKSVKCVIWLGKSNARIDQGVPAIPALLQRLQWYNPRLGFVEEHFRTHGIPIPTDPIWEGLRDVLAKKWFTRVWTFQEAVLPKELDILCGKNLIPSETLTQLVTFLRMMPESGSLEEMSAWVGRRKARIQAGLDRIATIATTRYQRAQHFPQSHFLDLLVRCSKWECGKPEDKIYGILGLVENDDELRGLLVPVTGEMISAADLYLKFARFWFQRDPHFQLFHFLPSNHLSSQLPSWCPSLLDPPIATTLWYYGVAAQYRAGIQVGRNQRVNLTENKKVIQVEGFAVDRIARVEQCPWERQSYQDTESRRLGAGLLMAWENRCLEHSKSVYSRFRGPLFGPRHTTVHMVADGADEVPDAHWRTAIANKHADGRLYSGFGEETYRLARIHMSNMAQVPHLLSPREQLLARQPRTPQQELQLLDYIEAWGYASHGRSFFTTECGRIGLGPLHTRPGDLVCIFYNGGSPYILRPRNDNRYFLIGESYVHGLMYGEALQLQNRNPDQFFTLV